MITYLKRHTNKTLDEPITITFNINLKLNWSWSKPSVQSTPFRKGSTLFCYCRTKTSILIKGLSNHPRQFDRNPNSMSAGLYGTIDGAVMHMNLAVWRHDQRALWRWKRGFEVASVRPLVNEKKDVIRVGWKGWSVKGLERITYYCIEIVDFG